MTTMTIDDQIGSDGVLRALISEQIDNKTYPVYPKTHADVVTYGDTTVKFKLDAFTAILTNVQSAMQNAAKAINNLKATSYDKEYISGALSDINTNINANTAKIIQVQQAYDALSYYTQPQLDQRFYNLNQDISRSINLINKTVSELSSYVNATFGTDADISKAIDRLTKSMHEADDDIRQLVADDFRQMTIDIHNQVAEQMLEYARTSDVNSEISNLHDNITSVSDTFSGFRGDVVIMNSKSENRVNEHTDAIKNELMTNSNNKFAIINDTMNDKLSEQTEALNNKYSQTAAAIGSIGSILNSKLEMIMGQLNSMGGILSPDSYTSADEEEY